MFFILLIITFLFSSTESMLAAVSPTKSSQSELHRKTKHTYMTFSTRLIHRSSPDFPYFNPNYTRSDHIKDSIRASIARSHYFSQIGARSETNYVAAPVHGLTFFMNYTMGTPPVPRYGMLDTGSSFTWFQCQPCIRCYYQRSYPLYHPDNSSSYEQVLCNTYQCNIAPNQNCKRIHFSPICQYDITYFDESGSRGIVSMDTLTLPSNKATETLENFVFGCGNDNQDRYGLPGIVGASNHPTSLHSQLGFSHFSYFVFANKTSLDGEAHFGPGASLSDTGANTPFLSSANGAYFLNLTGISVDGSDLDLPAGIFDKNEVNGGVIIDSGTPYSMLQSEALDKLKEAIADEMYMYTPAVSKSDRLELCYKDYKGGAPEVVFQFSGLDYALCDSNLWVKDSDNYYCLAILRSRMTILGVYQQRNVQVGYDLEKNLITLNSPDVCPGDVIDFMQ